MVEKVMYKIANKIGDWLFKGSNQETGSSLRNLEGVSYKHNCNFSTSFVALYSTNLFSPSHFGGSGGQTNAIGDNERYAKPHDDEEGLKSGVLLQCLEGHALENKTHSISSNPQNFNKKCQKTQYRCHGVMTADRRMNWYLDINISQ